jgi:hypothetical protein
MLTTKQVRAIMLSHNVPAINIYTNKTYASTSNVRRVKCYFTPTVNPQLLQVLKAATSPKNVKLLPKNSYATSLIVTCVLA